MNTWMKVENKLRIQLNSCRTGLKFNVITKGIVELRLTWSTHCRNKIATQQKRNYLCFGYTCNSVAGDSDQLGPGARFSKVPKSFRTRKAVAKAQTSSVTELFSHILNVNKGSLHIRCFRRIHFTVFRYKWTKNGFTGPKSFRGFRETGPWSISFYKVTIILQ